MPQDFLLLGFLLALDLFGASLLFLAILRRTKKGAIAFAITLIAAPVPSFIGTGLIMCIGASDADTITFFVCGLFGVMSACIGLVLSVVLYAIWQIVNRW